MTKYLSNEPIGPASGYDPEGAMTKAEEMELGEQEIKAFETIARALEPFPDSETCGRILDSVRVFLALNKLGETIWEEDPANDPA